jgi:ribosomal protein S17
MEQNKSVKTQKVQVIMNHQRKFGTLGVLIKTVVRYGKYSFTSIKERRILIHFDVKKFSEGELADDKFLFNKWVLIKPCRPMSKHKRFELHEVV